MIYDILDDAGNAINRIVADEEFIQAHYPNNHRFVGPIPSPPVYPVITKVAFRFRLTDAEYAGIINASKTDAEVQVWYDTFNMVTKIELDNERTKNGIATLVSKNLLTQARADEILNAPVLDQERAQ